MEARPSPNVWVQFDLTAQHYLKRGTRVFMLDLSQTKQLNSTGMAVLVRLREALSEAHASLVLRGVTRALHIAFEMLGTDSLFTFFPSRDAAVAHLKVPVPVEVSLSEVYA